MDADKLADRNVLWTILISRYIEQGYGEKELDCFMELLREGDLLLHFTMLICVLKAGRSIGVIC